MCGLLIPLFELCFEVAETQRRNHLEISVRVIEERLEIAKWPGSVTPAPEELMSSSGLCGYCSHTNILLPHTHTHKIKNKILKKAL